MLSGGYEALMLRVHLIRSATASIDIQTFIWTNDEVGRLMVWELIQAARRGVRVRIIADHMFSDQDPEVMAFLAAANPNFEVRHYRPATSRMKPGFWRTALAGLSSFRKVNQRMHSKVMLVDGVLLVTGGRNIENTYFDHSVTYNFRDRDVLVLGPVVADAMAEFEEFWQYRFTIPSRDLVDVSAVLKAGGFRRYDRREDYDFGGCFADLDAATDPHSGLVTGVVARLKTVDRAVFLSDAPGKWGGKRNREIARELGTIIGQAKSSVALQTPYLVLSGPARDLFRDLRAKSPAVPVRVCTNSFASTDNLYAYSANYRLRNMYVQDLGLAIYELKPQPAEMRTLIAKYDEVARRAKERAPAGSAEAKAPFISLHAKSLVIDEAVGFVGSFNLDPRSERLNTEVGLLVQDADFARALRDEIERDMAPENSWTIGQRHLPLRLDVVNELLGGVLSLSPIDLWPLQNTTSFDLIPGHVAVPPSDPAFHDHYREVGAFPGSEGVLSQREIMTRLFKAVGAPLTPIL